MIPKIIHYCWFGGNDLTDEVKKCIDSWRKFCPDFEIREWNEKNFDISCNTYVMEAYKSKKWAFVSDYVRLYVLEKFGGIYMDTDVELIRPIDRFLHLTAFTGFEKKEMAYTALVGSEKHSEVFKYLLTYYADKHFILPDGRMDITTNTEIVTKMLQAKYNVKLNNEYQEIPGIITIFPKDYFCPKSYETGEIVLTENTVCIHHFNGSWKSKIDKKMKQKRDNYISKYGEEKGKKLFSKWYARNILIIFIKKYGLIWTVKKIIKKLKGVK